MQENSVILIFNVMFLNAGQENGHLEDRALTLTAAHNKFTIHDTEAADQTWLICLKFCIASGDAV